MKDIATISIDMSTCDFDSDHRIFAKPIEFVDDTKTLLCEFESANYDYENTKMIKKLEEQIEDLKKICWLPLEHLGVASIDFDLIPMEEFVEGVKMEAYTDYDGNGVPVIKASGDRLLYQDKNISLDKIIDKKKLDFDFVAWFNR
jgi:hypothetical protein